MENSNAAAGGAASSFADDYDKAPVTGQQQVEPDGDENKDGSEQDLTIAGADVTKMEQLKQAGDMAALGTYVAQLLQ